MAYMTTSPLISSASGTSPASSRNTARTGARGPEAQPMGPMDWWLAAVVLTLLCIGLLMVLSTSGVIGERLAGDKYLFFKRQLIFAGAGPVTLIAAATLPRRVIDRLA